MTRDDLRPFWSYFGGKWRAAPHYPPPRYPHIVEPFAGSAGYALRYAHLRVMLVDIYPVIAAIWRWLIGASRADVLALPIVRDVRDLPDSLDPGAKALVGFCMSAAVTTPRVTMSAGCEANNSTMVGWTAERRERIASQVCRIRHWQIIEGDYTMAPDVEATWFVDPPYDNSAGENYPHHELDRHALAQWCRCRRGQVIACENEGASWLPFNPLRTFKRGMRAAGGSREVVWTKGCTMFDEAAP